MPPKKQPKPKFRRGRVDRVKKGKKKASQKQIVNVTVTSTGSGSGGSSMGVPSQPIFMPNTYQQPLFTPAVDPIKNTLTEVLKEPVKKKIPVAIPVEEWANGKGTVSSAKKTNFNSSGTQTNFDEIPMPSPDKSYGNVNEFVSPLPPPFDSPPRRRTTSAPREREPVPNTTGIPFYSGRGRPSKEYSTWKSNQPK